MPRNKWWKADTKKIGYSADSKKGKRKNRRVKNHDKYPKKIQNKLTQK